jgi:anti-anti-sigma factor
MELLRVYQTEPRGFRLVGELDLSSLHQLKPIDEKVPEGGDLHLDLARLKFMDGAALEHLAGIARRLKSSSGKLVVLRPQRSTERLLKRMAAVEHLDNLLISRLPTVNGDSFDAPVPPRDLSQVIVSDYSPEAACKLIAELALSAVEGAGSASIAVRQAGELVCAGSSDNLAGELEALQIDLAEGPTLDALISGAAQCTPSLVTDRRWPEFSNRALYRGIASVLSVPLPAHGSTFGALTLYGNSEGAFSQRGREQAGRLAAQGAVVIANSILYWQATELTDQLKEALESRAVIDQAKGILMAQEGMSAEEAFGTLLKASQSGNVKVREIAQKLVMSAQTGARVRGPLR